MPIPLTAPEVLDREFLVLRAKILELAAALDRLERATGSVAEDPRRQRLGQALDVVRQGQGERAEQVQLLFSRSYQEGWQESLGLTPRT